MSSELAPTEAADSVAELFTRPELQRFAPGRILFAANTAAAGVYILHSGEVALTSPTRTRIAAAGEILGISAVLSRSSYESSATARSLCEVGFIEAGEFRRLIERSPAVWFSVLRQLSLDVNAGGH
jgi:CRP-like cAMP-binding protein